MFYIVREFNAKRILDFGAGWGDRLVGAIAADVEEYCAFDPNLALKEGHDKIIETFVPKENKNRYHIHYEPYESANLPYFHEFF